jgi:hypothetical protein
VGTGFPVRDWKKHVNVESPALCSYKFCNL